MKILIIEDAPDIVAALRPVLLAQSYQVTVATSAAEALALASRATHDLALLDLGLPDGDGLDLIERLRALSVGVIVLSARHNEADKVRALDLGADDYVDKPFAMPELLARVRAAQRRLGAVTNGQTEEFRSRQLCVHYARREVKLLGEPVKLSPKEFALLEVLCRNAGQVATQRRLLIAGWNDPNADGQYLRSYIALLRQKLEYDPSEPELVLTEPGVGYRLAVDSEEPVT